MRGFDDRRNERFEVDGDVTLKVLMTRTDDVREVRARLVNAGAGGLFVRTDSDVPVGALAELDIQLDGRPLANTLGLVSWHQPGEGAGIEFFYTTDEERDAIVRYLEQWQRARER